MSKYVPGAGDCTITPLLSKHCEVPMTPAGVLVIVQVVSADRKPLPEICTISVVVLVLALMELGLRVIFGAGVVKVKMA
jgi:hypothetical protein